MKTKNINIKKSLNQSGQGTLEALITLPVLLVFLFSIFEYFLYVNIDLAVDELLDNSLICKIDSFPNRCDQINSKLRQLPIKINQFDLVQTGTLYRLKISYITLHFFETTKTRELNYDLKI